MMSLSVAEAELKRYRRIGSGSIIAARKLKCKAWFRSNSRARKIEQQLGDIFVRYLCSADAVDVSSQFAFV